MKALFTLLFILIATVAMAQNSKQNDKVDTIEIGVTLVDGNTDINGAKTVTINPETSVARLYRYKNSRVTRELTFVTRINYGKLA
ncbi:hypothetical protein ACNR9Q_08900 [Maribacter sp. X9]|uniref:hypothetical protein n=1 Tax=Maribacter sp. X9 TaxID=3402159 RepID=UPI003AF38012